MKRLLLALALASSQIYGHGHHHHVHINGTMESVAGWSSLAWNSLELGFHTAELLGYKPTFKPPCKGCKNHATHALAAIAIPSKLEQSYHVFEQVTHGLNLFDTSAKMFDSVSETIENYLPPEVVSFGAIVTNLGVILYRIVDAKNLFNVVRAEPTNLAAYGFWIWGLIDALGHVSSIYVAQLGH